MGDAEELEDSRCRPPCLSVICARAYFRDCNWNLSNSKALPPGARSAKGTAGKGSLCDTSDSTSLPSPHPLPSSTFSPLDVERFGLATLLLPSRPLSLPSPQARARAAMTLTLTCAVGGEGVPEGSTVADQRTFVYARFRGIRGFSPGAQADSSSTRYHQLLHSSSQSILLHPTTD